MSTVQNILENASYHLDPSEPLYNFLNLVVRMIAKRLFLLKSDLLIGELSVGIYDSDTLTASDIAFVDADPDTITSVAAEFVTSGFVSGMPITTDNASNLGPFRIDSVVAGTITLVSTNELTAVGAGAETIITSDDGYGFLPSDFWGLKEEPHINGKTWALRPLPSKKHKLIYATASSPRWFQIKGMEIHVTPPTSADITINGDYWKRPTTLSETTHIIPYDELFDDAVTQCLVQYYKSGKADQIPDMVVMEDYLNKAVDGMAVNRDLKHPKELPETTGIDWNNLMEM